MNDVVGEWCVNGYGYVLVSDAYPGIVGHRMVGSIGYDGPRNPTNATEQCSIRKRTASYFETSGAIALGS